MLTKLMLGEPSVIAGMPPKLTEIGQAYMDTLPLGSVINHGLDVLSVVAVGMVLETRPSTPPEDGTAYPDDLKIRQEVVVQRVGFRKAEGPIAMLTMQQQGPGPAFPPGQAPNGAQRR